MSTVNLSELHGALEWVSDELMDNEAYVCRRTGKIFWISGEPGVLDRKDEVPADVENAEKYVPVPHGHDLDLGSRLAFDFARQFLADQYDDVRSIFRHRGAYRRFKDLLQSRDSLEEWYAYSEERTIKALKEWCKSEGLGIEQ